MMRRVLNLTLAGTMMVSLTACATSGARQDGAPTTSETAKNGDVKSERIEADPMLVKAGVDGKPAESIDSREVFQKAYSAYSARQYEEAAQHYEVIVKYFEDSRFFQPSLYNGGLAYEKLERWKDAARFYRKIVQNYPGEDDTTDAYYRLAEAYQHLGEHRKIVELMTRAMLRDGLSTFDRIEAHVRRANALLEVGKLSDAGESYRSVLKLNQRAPAEERLQTDARYIVRAYFGLGKVYHRKSSEITLTLPPESMGQDLEEKAQLLLRAQKHYLDALRQHHPHWSVAAGFMIGQLYEDFYSDIYAAEIPDDLTEKQVHLYFEELRGRIDPLMKRAIKVYKKNLSLSKRIGQTADSNEWVEQTEESLRRMQAFLNDPKVQRRAEKLAFEGRDFRTLWQPVEMAVDTVDGAVTKAMEKVREKAVQKKADDKGQGPES